MSQNALSRKVNGNGKVIMDTHPESDQHQNWTCSTGSPPAPTHQIWWWSMNPFLGYLADKHNAHRHTDTQTDTRRWPQDLAAYGAQVIIINYNLCESSCARIIRCANHPVTVIRIVRNVLVRPQDDCVTRRLFWHRHNTNLGSSYFKLLVTAVLSYAHMWYITGTVPLNVIRLCI